MNEPNNPVRVERGAAVGEGEGARATEAARQLSDSILAVRLQLARLGADLNVAARQREQWCAYVDAVLRQMEYLIGARVEADAVTWNDDVGRELKQRLIRQVIATPILLSEAAKRLHAALTPEQQLAGGEKLLHFHRQLLA
jgi:LTXXQ motif family protein